MKHTDSWKADLNKSKRTSPPLWSVEKETHTISVSDSVCVPADGSWEKDVVRVDGKCKKDVYLLFCLEHAYVSVDFFKNRLKSAARCLWR